MQNFAMSMTPAYNIPRSLHSSFMCKLHRSRFSQNTNKKHSSARSFHNAVTTFWDRLSDMIHNVEDFQP